MQPSTVLFLAANPVATQALQLGEECRAIEDKIRAAKFRDQIRFRSRWAARPDDLLQALNEDSPSVLHFSGHGAGNQGLCFQAEDGSALSVSAGGLAQVMRAAGAGVVVVLLNACYSEVQAQALIAHVPCVIGMPAAISDEAAITYAAAFYRALAFGKSVANAHEQGIAAFALPAADGQARDVEMSTSANLASSPRLLTRPDIDADCIYIVQGAHEKTRCTIIIKATLREFNAEVLARVTEELRRWTGDLSLQILDVDEGSVRLTISLTPDAAKRLVEMIQIGRLTQICGFDVVALLSSSGREVARAAVGAAATQNRGRAPFHEQLITWGVKSVMGSGRYQVVRALNTGGMGVVYETYDFERRRNVALKTISNPSVEKIDQLKREFRALADLSHPNLVAVYDLVVSDDSCFFTMELLDGVGLLTYLRNPKIQDPQETPCDLDRLRHALPQLVRGLYALHSAGMIHRDVKPSNIQVTSDGRVVLLDFGLVAELDHQQGGDGTIVGTPAYMAPEQCAGDVRITAAADWYGFGVVLFQTLTGRLPFEGELTQILLEKQTKPAPRPSQFVQHIPPDLDGLCAELLEREPGDRPTGEQLLRRLGLADSGIRGS